MAQYTYSSLDIVGLIFLMLALTAFVYAVRGKTFSTNDREASAPVLDGHTDESSAAEDRRRIRSGGPVLLVVFLVMLLLMVLAPVTTIFLANRAVSGSVARVKPGIDP